VATQKWLVDKTGHGKLCEATLTLTGYNGEVIDRKTAKAIKDYEKEVTHAGL
jgi:hypothetical protein